MNSIERAPMHSRYGHSGALARDYKEMSKKRQHVFLWVCPAMPPKTCCSVKWCSSPISAASSTQFPPFVCLIMAYFCYHSGRHCPAAIGLDYSSAIYLFVNKPLSNCEYANFFKTQKSDLKNQILRLGWNVSVSIYIYIYTYWCLIYICLSIRIPFMWY